MLKLMFNNLNKTKLSEFENNVVSCMGQNTSL